MKILSPSIFHGFKTSFFLLISIPLFTAQSLFAQDEGDLDDSFGVNGTGVVNIDIGNNTHDGISDLLLLPNGNIIAGGFVNDNFDFNFMLIQVQEDGTLDPSFGNNGVVETDITFGNDEITSLALQSDGKIIAAGVVAGESLLGDPTQDAIVARYLPDGTLDTSFGSSGITVIDVTDVLGSFLPANDFISSVAIHPDGSILAGGTEYSDNGDFFLLRFLADGTLDTSFGIDGVARTDFNGGWDILREIRIQPDGKIVAGGSAFDGNDSSFGLTRYMQNGTLDTSFGSNGLVITDIFNTAADYITTIKLLPNGSIIAGGVVEFAFQQLVLARYHADGTLDTSFGEDNGITIESYFLNADQLNVDLNDMVIESSGKIVVVGNLYNFVQSRFFAGRFTANGIEDNTFSDNGFNANIGSGLLGGGHRGVIAQNDGKIVAAGFSETSAAHFNTVLARYHSDVVVSTTTASNALAHITVFPNPTSESIQVHWELVEKAPVAITLSSSIGKVVYTTNLAEQCSGPHVHIIPSSLIRRLSSGVYMLQVLVDGYTTTYTVVKID